ncbi:hypothetical protein C0J52_06501 [Blattella germanica]|nr:hypothetical protein C0J52_06501 [Blattella germanica]
MFSDEATFHIEHVRDSPKVNVFCAISHSSVYGPFFFDGGTVNGQQYLAMSRHVRQYLNETLPNRWIGRQGPGDLALHSWPPRSSNPMPCDFFLWGLR